MSLDSTACYRFQNTSINLTQAQAFLASLDIHFAGIVSHYFFDADGDLQEWLGLPQDITQASSRFASLRESWEFYAQAVNSGALSLNCSMHHREFHFTMGFVAAQDGPYMLLQIEDNDIYEMGETLPTYGLNARSFFTRLLQAFTAESFVYARDVYFETLRKYLKGIASPSDVESTLMMVIAVPNSTSDLLRRNGGQDLLVDGARIVSRNFFGAPLLK